jgi:hypothetical protein
MSSSSSVAWEDEMLVALDTLQTKRRNEISWFLEPVDWQALGIPLYPSIVRRPMDLKTVRSRINNREFSSRPECVEDVRCIWTNAMLFNGLGSKVYTHAKLCSETFESLINGTIGVQELLPSNEELNEFAEQCFKLSPEDLGKILLLLDKLCPRCLLRSQAQDEVQLNVDLLTPTAFAEANRLLQSHIVAASHANFHSHMPPHGKHTHTSKMPGTGSGPHAGNKQEKNKEQDGAKVGGHSSKKAKHGK